MNSSRNNRRSVLLAAALAIAAFAAPNLAQAGSQNSPKSTQKAPMKSEDQLAILDLIARMNIAVDSDNYAAYAAFYAEDGQLDTGFGPPVVGHAAIKGVLDQSAPFISNERHVATNITLDRGVQGITATYYLTVFERQASLTVAGTAFVTDEFRHGPNGWKVVRHTTRMDPAAVKAMQAAMSGAKP